MMRSWTPGVQVAGLLPGRAPGRLTEPAAPQHGEAAHLCHPSLRTATFPLTPVWPDPAEITGGPSAFPWHRAGRAAGAALRPGASAGSPGKWWPQLAPGYHDGNRGALALRGGLLRGSVGSVFDSEGPAAGIGTPAMA